MATEKHVESGAVRDRAKDELRQCQRLIHSLFEAHGEMLSGQAVKKEKDTRMKPVVQNDAVPEPVQIMEKLVDQQKSLRKLIDEVLEHQRLNGIIEELRKANGVEDDKIAHLGANLRAAEAVLQNALDEARPRVAAMKRANKRPVDVDEVISYGSKISATLAAPQGWDQSQPLGNHLPPAPTDEMMRAGKLAAISIQDETNAAEAEKQPDSKA